nr:unnamed protein product [Callosobruchus analis]
MSLSVVSELPEYPPTISVSREPLDYGDTLKANCSCSPSRPRATLTFYLNDIMVNRILFSAISLISLLSLSDWMCTQDTGIPEP